MSSSSGIQNPAVIDAMGYDASHDEYVLAMLETRESDGSPERVAELQDKLNGYIHFVDSGQFWKMEPDAVGKRVRFELRFLHPPDHGIRRFVEAANEHLRLHRIRLVVRVTGDRDPEA